MNFRRLKQFFLILVDVLIVFYTNGFILLFAETRHIETPDLLLYYFSLSSLQAALFVAAFAVLGLYQSIWKYADASEYLRVIGATVFADVTYVLLFMMLHLWPFSLAAIITAPIIAGFFMLCIRLILCRYVHSTAKMKADKEAKKKRLMIVGAGNAGAILLNEIRNNRDVKYEPVCIADDNPEKEDKKLNGVPVLGKTNDIKILAESNSIDVIIIAIPSLDRTEMQRIIQVCCTTNCEIRTLPGISIENYSNRKNMISLVRQIEIDDLLGRSQVHFNQEQISAYLSGKRVLVTGGGGSIGSELCRKIIAVHPELLIIVDVNENTVYELYHEIKQKYGNGDNLRLEIASVRDYDKLDYIYSLYKPHVVFHAAAHKHVPLMEANPEEAVKNNVMGTYNNAKAADKYGAERFILISTDKAVNPTNVMGTSKRICEMIIQWMDNRSKTLYSCVRFGNVLGSSGSVVPLFKRQIASGGPVTVTHPDIIRYFMTIPEAAHLVLVAGKLSKGGEVFVLNMGDPVRIDELARNMIRLCGLVPDIDIKIAYTGLRPGEKMYEELLMADEALLPTDDERIYISQQKPVSEDFEHQMFKLNEIAETMDRNDLIRALHELVPNFLPQMQGSRQEASPQKNIPNAHIGQKEGYAVT